MAEIVVVGSGIAGLATALYAGSAGTGDTPGAGHTVTLLTKDALSESNTRYAQGGIAAATAADDTTGLHAEDTVRAGAGLGDRDAARILAEAGPRAIADLVAWGVDFDRSGTDSEPARALEAAHSRARVLHVGGDATGAAIEAALVAAVRRSGVVVREHVLLTELVRDAGRIAGVDVVDLRGAPGGGSGGHAAMERISADAVVLATGGAGLLFAHTTNPAVATGDGLAAAIRAGAVTADLEFYQFHPTALAAPGSFLISEAVRGEGAVLRNAAGERFMVNVHPDAELAPRDVVARAIAAEMARQDGVPIHLDARGVAAEHGRAALECRFPTIVAACAAAGLDLAEDLIPVTCAAHYYMGGIATDLDGRTSIPGLLAVGEVANTGVHGANRLASNSLLEGVVFARRAAMALDAPNAQTAPGRPVAGGALPEPADGNPRAAALHQGGIDRAALQRLMWQHAGLVRSAAGLEAASIRLSEWADAADETHAPDPNVRERVENANLLIVARALVAAAAARRESRGAHARSDFPQTDVVATRATTERRVAVPC